MIDDVGWHKMQWRTQCENGGIAKTSGMSTCDYAFEGARYVVQGRLLPIN